MVMQIALGVALGIIAAVVVLRYWRSLATVILFVVAAVVAIILVILAFTFDGSRQIILAVTPALMGMVAVGSGWKCLEVMRAETAKNPLVSAAMTGAVATLSTRDRFLRAVLHAEIWIASIAVGVAIFWAESAILLKLFPNALHFL